ncbi:MAG: YeaH/YhbH family protein, partial [Ideonella sp.]
MQQIIDRRLAGKNKSIGNRERFLRRHKDQIREAVKRAVDGRGIRDLAQGEDIHIPKRDISEPVFGHGQGGKRDMVHPGNQDYVRGDRIERPKGGGGGGGGGGQASDSGEGDDDFVFHLSKEEFMQVFFDDLALPNLARTTLAETPEFKTHRAGYSSDGTPNNLHVVRSMRGAIGRRMALGSDSRRIVKELEEKLALLKDCGDAAAHADEISALEQEIEALRQRIDRIPYLDPIDLRFRSRVRVPVPTAKAVMFCLMDVSGSMDESRKDLAKRFFILLYLFLTRHYERIDIVFIRHHTQAQEVDEQNFFHSTETGGTVVSSALVLMEEIARARYPTSEWNIYGAQASDGDNWHHDSGRCRELLANSILPLCRYFAYVQVAEEEQNLWDEYAALAAGSKMFA